MAKAIATGAKTVKGINVNLKKVGTAFPMALLDEADAILIGSPTIYSHVTHEIKNFLDAVTDLKKRGRLKLKGKIGAAFGSYGWDGGWNLQELENIMKEIGITVDVPLVEAVDIPSEKVLKTCTELGKTIAQKTLGNSKETQPSKKVK
jgi:flavorubredoxin